MAIRGDLHAVGELLDVGGDDLRARFEALADFHAIAEAIAEDDFTAGDLAVLDDEHAVGAVAALHRGDRES